VNFFFDNCISFRIARALNVLDEHNEIVPFRDKFPVEIKDIEWISELAKESDKWVVVSGDSRISRNKAEREAWLEGELTAFFWEPGWENLPHWRKAATMVKWWPAITDQARKIAPGAGFLIPVRSSRLRQVR
jgi:PIN like domain